MVSLASNLDLIFGGFRYELRLHSGDLRNGCASFSLVSSMPPVQSRRKAEGNDGESAC
jgi:hypothetical protein